MGTGKMKKMPREQQQAVGASMNEAAGKMLSPTNFNRALFGSMGANPSINALTNANAIAAQQMPQMPQMPQQPPVTPAVGVYGRPDMRAQMMGVGSTISPIARHDNVKSQIEAKKEEIKKAKAEGGDPDIVYELQSDLMDLEKELDAAKEEHKNK